MQRVCACCVCFEQACGLLDEKTALRYATYSELGKSQGIVESMESLADFLRSEAITLDRLGLSNQSLRANLNVLKQEPKQDKDAQQQSQNQFKPFLAANFLTVLLTVRYTCSNQSKIDDNS